MDLSLAGRRAAVAASSSGLGFAIAARLAAEGASVAICGRDRDRIDRAASTIDGVVSASVCDVSKRGATAEWLASVAADFGGLDIVIPNAGGPPPGSFDDGGPETWDRGYDLTLRSALEAAQAAGSHLGSGGALLFLTSSSVRQPVGTLAMSTVFRAGVAALAKLLADEWAPRGIRVNHLIPGRIATDRVATLDADLATRTGSTPAEVRQRFEGTLPLGRYGEPDEFAAAAAFLVSGAASYITGATLAVDGGALRAING